MNHVYEDHPISHIRLYCDYMSCWNEVKRVALEATEIFTGVAYASWDIGVIEWHNVAIVEGNSFGNFNIQQVQRPKGMWPIYKQFIKEWKYITNPFFKEVCR